MQTKADVAGIIRTLIECAERDSIYGGFICMIALVNRTMKPDLRTNSHRLLHTGEG
jgi:hypothetical protein